MKIYLLISILLLLQACSTKVVVEYRDRVHVMPDNLLVSPCNGLPAGDSVRSLARGYVGNTTCLKQHILLLEKQQKYKTEMERLYGDP